VRRWIIQVIVNRGWPLTLATYFALAATSLIRDNDTFKLYSYGGDTVTAAFIAGAVASVPTGIWPRVPLLRWVFFVAAGFVMTGRITQEGAVTIDGAARAAFTFAALLAHLVIQVDWMIEREADRRAL